MLFNTETIYGWYPIPTGWIKDTEKIDHYIEKGILRRINDTNISLNTNEKENETQIKEHITLYKQITYKIEILRLSNNIPIEFQNDFVEWLKSKAVELGLGKQCEYYYNHDETGDSPIEVLFLCKL